MASKYESVKSSGIPIFEPNNQDIYLSDCVNVDKYIELTREIERV